MPGTTLEIAVPVAVPIGATGIRVDFAVTGILALRTAITQSLRTGAGLGWNAITQSVMCAMSGNNR